MARAAGPHRMGRMMALIGIPAMLARCSARPRGLLVDDLSWRWIFFVNLPIGIAALIACTRVLPADRPEPSSSSTCGLPPARPRLAAFVYGPLRAPRPTRSPRRRCSPGAEPPLLIGLFVANSLAGRTWR